MKITHISPNVKKILSILKERHYIKFSSYLILSVVLLLVIFLAWSKPSSRIDLKSEIRPIGSVSGYVVNRHGSPIEGVMVSIPERSEIPDVSDANGFYTVDNVSGGIQSLCFTHKEYESDTVLIEQKEGVNDTLTPTVLLSSVEKQQLRELKRRLIEKAVMAYGQIYPCSACGGFNDCFSMQGNSLYFWFIIEDEDSHLLNVIISRTIWSIIPEEVS